MYWYNTVRIKDNKEYRKVHLSSSWCTASTAFYLGKNYSSIYPWAGTKKGS